jgi:MlaA lipoprotein
MVREGQVGRPPEIKRKVRIILMRTKQCAKKLASILMVVWLAALVVVSTAFAQSAMGADQAAAPRPPGERALPGEAGAPYPDPLELFNSAMFNFNIDVDQYVVTPAAKGYSYMMPEAGRQGVNNFFRSVRSPPHECRFAVPAGTQVTRPCVLTSTSTVLAQRKTRMLGSFRPHATYGMVKWVVAVNRSPLGRTIVSRVISCAAP